MLDVIFTIMLFMIFGSILAAAIAVLILVIRFVVRGW